MRYLGAIVVTTLLAILPLGAQVATSTPAQLPCPDARAASTYLAGAAPSGEPGPNYVMCRFYTGAVAMEPSIAISKDNRLFFDAWGTNQGSTGGLPAVPHVLRSSDNAVHWTDVSPGLPGHQESLDPILYLDPRTDRIFSVDFSAAVFPMCSLLSFSDDGGTTWTTSPLACGGFDGESIGAGPPVSSQPVGYPDLVYYCTGTTLGSSPPTTTPLCSKSLDGGLTFAPTGSPPYPAFGQQDVFAPWAGNPVVGPDGTVYIPKRFNGQPQLAISHDEGLTWTQVMVATNGSGGEANRVAVDAAGNLYYTWVDGLHLPYLSLSRDGGNAWGKPIALAPKGLREAAFPRPAVDSAGRVVIVYLGSTNAPAVPPYYASCNVHLSECTDGTYAGATWNGYMTVIDDAFAARPVLRTATVNPASSPLFTGGCSADAACKAVLDFVDVQFDHRGVAWGAFVDDCKLTRQFPPLFNAGAARCEDGVGEGVVGQMSVAASTPASPDVLPNTGAAGDAAVLVLLLAATGAYLPLRIRKRGPKDPILLG